MSSKIMLTCDVCGKEKEFSSNVVINVYERGRYQSREEEHYCADFDMCKECCKKYKILEYNTIVEKINFIKENDKFLSKLWGKVRGHKEDRVKNN